MMPRFFLGIVLSLGIFIPCSAQQYPAKPVRIIVPFPVGGIADIYARLIGNRWTEAWGQPVVVENRTGASGTIGTDFVAKAPPDGYTVLMSASAHVIVPSLLPKVPYDAIRDFAPVTVVMSSPLVLVVTPTLPVKSVKELVALAKVWPAMQ